ncbi:protein MIZU-KUSSEI 1 [Impatiens glandulifera]|uniref:protein MIZU-KUSSEI 1 n=1 Tax=Impatiens glandulifera TaxID=253017 RepID=UPI001FB17245|nr:protein MIZU-KUSSEI 1 [Impatiens glandulifera]
MTMTMINALRRYLLPCFSPIEVTSSSSAAVSSSGAGKKRLSTSLRDDIIESTRNSAAADGGDSPSASELAAPTVVAPARPSRTMVIGTIFGRRRGHVWFSVQLDRVQKRPALLLEFPIPTHILVREMRCGLVRIALESDTNQSDMDIGSCPLHSVPVWAMFCNGRQLGFAVRRKATDKTRMLLKTMQSITVGAGVIPAGIGCGSAEDVDSEIIYMRANYECIVGGPDSESFHLINPDECPGQELSIFLMRVR